MHIDEELNNVPPTGATWRFSVLRDRQDFYAQEEALGRGDNGVFVYRKPIPREDGVDLESLEIAESSSQLHNLFDTQRTTTASTPLLRRETIRTTESVSTRTFSGPPYDESLFDGSSMGTRQSRSSHHGSSRELACIDSATVKTTGSSSLLRHIKHRHRHDVHSSGIHGEVLPSA